MPSGKTSLHLQGPHYIFTVCMSSGIGLLYTGTRGKASGIRRSAEAGNTAPPALGKRSRPIPKIIDAPDGKNLPFHGLKRLTAEDASPGLTMPERVPAVPIRDFKPFVIEANA